MQALTLKNTTKNLSLIAAGALMAAMIAVPIVSFFAFPQAAIPSYFVSALVLLRHAPRIKNVLDGTEPKMYYKIR